MDFRLSTQKSAVKKCQVCGKDFESKIRNKKTCSDRCAIEMKRRRTNLWNNSRSRSRQNEHNYSEET